jgi:hypothetical protein
MTDSSIDDSAGNHGTRRQSAGPGGIRSRPAGGTTVDGGTTRRTYPLSDPADGGFRWVEANRSFHWVETSNSSADVDRSKSPDRGSAAGDVSASAPDESEPEPKDGEDETKSPSLFGWLKAKLGL